MDSTLRTLDEAYQLTSQREFDALGVALLQILSRHITARSMRVYKMAAHYGERHVSVVARTAARRNGTIDARHGGASALQPLRDFPHLEVCLRQHVFVWARRDREDPGQYVYPLYWGTELTGFLEICARRYARNDRNLVERFLRIFHTHTQLLEENERDTLTGLLNRKTFENNLVRMLSETRVAQDSATRDSMSRPRRRGANASASHWLAVADIDHFKRINDTYGHIFGDEVLLLIANLMRQSFRANDRLFRFGGEEFVILLAPTDYDNAHGVLERFRSRVERYDFPQIGRVTTSIGFTRVGERDFPTTAIDQADKALYFAKQHGRNRTHSYDELMSQHKIRSAIDHTDVEFFS